MPLLESASVYNMVHKLLHVPTVYCLVSDQSLGDPTSYPPSPKTTVTSYPLSTYPTSQVCCEDKMVSFECCPEFLGRRWDKIILS